MVEMYGAPTRHTEDFEERGFVLVDRYTKTQDNIRGLDVISGTCLVLLMEGRLAELERSGIIYTEMDGEWTATMRFTTPEEAVTRCGLESCMAAP
ncbi:MAG TPA: hypothetical protein VFZ09_17065 [Archangium sp.]|uniref:hypothetical protein n=1 Tax=Archangium sp. TaxID=1872627 RepID=UPI002E36FA50|nr:hypothetical protein [Archangium sp.]HEX5747955.1 hypothetical protein [Archangium sp.]